MKKFNTTIITHLKYFLILLGGQSISQLGSSMTSFALIIWAYENKGTVMSISMLGVCTYLPYILVSIFAGTFIDKWNKKVVMLFSDSIAAICTLCVLILYYLAILKLWNIYIINTLIGFMNAFQSPAYNVAVTLIVSKEQYNRISGLQSLCNSFITTFTPVFATAIISFSGIKAILIIDLITFSVAFSSLLVFIKIPNNKEENYGPKGYSFFYECKKGFLYLLQEKGILYLIVFMSIINLLASMADSSVLPAMILSRTNNNKVLLGFVTSAIGVGGIVGGIIVTIIKPPKSKVKTIFNSCALSFLLSDVLLGGSQNIYIWILAAFAGNIPIPFLNGSEMSILRTKIPVNIQGRVFAIRSAIQFSTIPLGYLLGGILSDKVFEPLMLKSKLMQQTMGKIVGTGKGSGMAMIFLIIGITGFLLSITFKKNTKIKELDK